MRHPALTLRPAFWILWVCVLLLPHFAAAEASLAIDLDGDGWRDQILLDRREPSVLRIWLSGSSATQVIRSPMPLLQIVAADLDGDHRPEVIASDGDAQLHVWERKGEAFQSYRPRGVVPGTLKQPNRRSIEDNDTEAPGAIAGTPTAPFALTLCASALTAGLEACPACTRQTARAGRWSMAVAPFIPRPPPAHVPL